MGEEAGEGLEEEAGGDEILAAQDSNFRRQGLPVREIVERRGDVYVHVHVGGADTLIGQMALALQLRRECINAHARASTPGYGAVRVNEWAALRRLSQVQVGRALMHEWCQRHGSEYGLEPDAAHPETGRGESLRRAQGYYKTYCFNVYGGQHWLKFLVALGEVWGDDKNLSFLTSCEGSRFLWSFAQQDRTGTHTALNSNNNSSSSNNSYQQRQKQQQQQQQ